MTIDTKGWKMLDLSDKILSVSTPHKPVEPCPFGGHLPKAGRWTLWTFPASYAFDLPQRDCVKVTDGVEEKIEKQPVDMKPVLTGQIGTMWDIEIHTDAFREPMLQTKYYFIPKHTKRGVEVYVFERGVANVHHLYKYRSARAARVAMKQHCIPEHHYYRPNRK
jgi:hypothetical protein